MGYDLEATPTVLWDTCGTVRTALPIPEWGHELAKRLFSEGITQEPLDRMLVNEYLQGIAMHGDYAPYGRTVVSLNLWLLCVMDFQNLATGRKERLLMELRSLLVLSDQARL